MIYFIIIIWYWDWICLWITHFWIFGWFLNEIFLFLELFYFCWKFVYFLKKNICYSIVFCLFFILAFLFDFTFSHCKMFKIFFVDFMIYFLAVFLDFMIDFGLRFGLWNIFEDTWNYCFYFIILLLNNERER